MILENSSGIKKIGNSIFLLLHIKIKINHVKYTS
jgi:hypothetical protein